jgi:predicted permease
MWIWIYRRLLGLLNASLREGYGASMEETFEERLAAAHAQGVWARTRVGARECVALIAIVLSERRQRSSDGGPDVRQPPPAGGPGDFVREVRLAVRGLSRRPSFTIPVVLTLAIGLGANAAIFSAIDAVLLRASPFPDVDRMVVIWQTDEASGTTHEPASWPDVTDFRASTRSFSAVGALAGVSTTVILSDGAQQVTGLGVSPGLLDVLQIEPLAGRAFASDDWTAGSPTSALLGERYWRSQFGGDPSVIGTSLDVNGTPVTILGILPDEASMGIEQIHARADYADDFLGAPVDLWLAIEPTAEAAAPRGQHNALTLGRLAPGFDLGGASDEMRSLAEELAAIHLENADRGVHLEAYGDVVFGRARSLLGVLGLAGILVLVVAVANIANLMLVRGIARGRETATRRALGASRGQIRRQFMVEGFVVSGIAAVLGLGVAYLALEALIALAPSDVPRLSAATLNVRALGVSTVLAIGVALLLGLVTSSVVQWTSGGAAIAARGGLRSTESRGIGRLRSTLVVAEVALAVMLVVSAGVLTRSYLVLRGTDPGFDTEAVMKARYRLPLAWFATGGDGSPGPARIAEFNHTFVERAAATPGVEAAAGALDHPLDPGRTSSFVIVGREAERMPEIRWRVVTPGYATTLGIPVLAGRDLLPNDAAGAGPVALVNRAAADRYFAGDPLGQELRLFGRNMRIVGVLGDERFLGVTVPAEPAVYLPMEQLPFLTAFPSAVLLVRAADDPTSLTPPIRAALHELDETTALYAVEPMGAVLNASLDSPRFAAALLSVFAGVGLLLAIIGIHGVLSFTITQRSAEMGIRIALGASRGHVLRHVVTHGVLLSTLGVALGAVGAAAISRLLGSMVHGVSAIDIPTYVVVVVCLLLTAALASLGPAVRASRSDPLAALKAG